MCCHHECHGSSASPRRGGIIKTLLSVVMLYIVLVFGGGTLIQTGHPVAVEVGRLLQMITFVEPTIAWADHSGYDALAGGLRVLADGIEVGRYT